MLSAMRLPAVALVLALTPATAIANPVWRPHTRGQYPVGYSVLFRRDSGRSLLNSEGYTVARPVRIDVWYPAARSAQPQLRLGDYVRATARDSDFAKPTAETIRQVEQKFLRDTGASADVLKDEMLARRDAPPRAGRYPLVLYAHTATSSKCFLAEVLASNGYVVMAPQVVGTYEPPLDVAMSGIETQTRDLEFVLREAALRPYVDPTRVAVAGMSFGALSALSLGMRNPSIAAVVSLDGGIGSTANVENFGFERGPFHDVSHFTQPLLHLYGPSVAGTDLGYLTKLEYSERYLIAVTNLTHADFGGTAVVRPGAPVPSFESVLRLVLAFLDTNLKGVHGWQEALPSRDSVTHLTARPHPPRATELAALVKSGSIAALRERYRVLALRDPHPIPVATYRMVVFITSEDGDVTGARDVARLFAEDYSTSARAALTLGSLEERLGNKTEATAAFQRALDLAPADPLLDAAQRAQVAATAKAKLAAPREQ